MVEQLNEIKVFRMNDYEWWASKWDKEATNEWYKKEYGLEEEENPLEEVKECDLDQEGVWWLTEDKEDIEKLGDSDEIIGIEIIKGMHKRKVQFGDLQRRHGEVYKYVSFKEAIKKDLDFEEPYCIAGIDW